MKIGTFSLNINTHDLNYGALLHSWAFQQFINNYTESECEIIDYVTPQFESMNFKYPQLYYFREGQLKRALTETLRVYSHSRRYEQFKDFIVKNMTLSSEQYTQEKLMYSKLDYDVLVSESDVIWNPGFFRGKFDRTFFLAYPTMKDKIRVSYAASMAARLSS